MRRVVGGLLETMMENGDSGGHFGSSAQKYAVGARDSGDDSSPGPMPESPCLAFAARVRVSSAMQTRVRPHTIAIRQSSWESLDARPLVRLGRFSPVSNTSRAASQYGTALSGSPASANAGSCPIMFPNKKRAVPRIV
jgi:hypothetical protein